MKLIKLKHTRTWKIYLKVPRRLKERILSLLMAIVDHFIKSDPFRAALREVIQNNRPQMREILDVWGPEFEGMASAKIGDDPSLGTTYISNVNAGKKAVENIVLADILLNGINPESPVCSIVIPVFNKDYLTYRCIRSILIANVSVSFEIIVVDNFSSDHTREVLEHFRNCVQVMRNRENMGFVFSCNQGAAAAKGRFLVFLNNDTEVPDNWLDRLVETTALFDNIGAVGAKLVYPDGILQEAGGIIWRDASGSNYGKGEERYDPEYNYLREVDYCSGACLMVRNDLFKRLGGFDMRYYPAYYEDTDLCFGIRSMGYRVLYQPLCEIIHYEGATAGRDINSGFKRFQGINKNKFAAKWKEVLKLQMPQSVENTSVACDRRSGPRILFIDHQVPKCDQDSGSVRIFAIMKILTQLGCRVSFILRWGQPFDSYAKALGSIGVRVVREEGGAVWDELSRGDFDIIVISRVHVAELYLDKIKSAAPDTPVVFDTVDVHFIREMRMAELLGDSVEIDKAQKTREMELNIARSCELIIAVTDVDREHLLKEDPSLNVTVIPNIHQKIDVIPSTEGRSSIMFIGGFGHPPNVDAMLYFVREILPLIRRELGDVEFFIVGSSPPDEVMALSSDNIIVTGYVPDTAPYFRKSRVFVAPLRYGAGMKGKIGEAMSHGVPVVTTSIGAEGMGLVHCETALIQDAPEAFAKEVAKLYRDDALWMKLAVHGQQFIEKNFGPNAVKGNVAILNELAVRYTKNVQVN